jgi:hypothetical protein
MKKFLIILTICTGVFTAQNHATMPPDAEVNTDYSIPYTGYRQSPGIEVGVTDYDWQTNGSMGRYVWVTPSGGHSFYWTYRFGGSNPNRRAYYNYYYPPSYWLGPTAMDTRLSRMGAMDQMTDGRALGAAHANATVGYETCVYLDAAEGAGTFTVIPVPWAGDPNVTPIWPKICVDDSNYIYIAASQSGGPYAYWNMSTDEGTTWRGWDSTLAGVALNSFNYDYGGHEVWAQYGDRVALVNNMGDEYFTIVYWESSDHGATWSYDTVYCMETSPGDSVQGFWWNNAIYDNSGYLHVVFTVVDTTASGGGDSYSGWRSLIRHWNQQTNQMSIVASGWWPRNPGPGTYHPTVSEAQIAINRLTETLYCTWCQADSDDVAANGYTNLDIYAAYSTNNGTTWSGPHNLTYSHSPGASAGNCENDWWQSITIHNDTLYLFYMNDKDAGSSEWNEGMPTVNPMLFYPCWIPLGIEEPKTTKYVNPVLRIVPNPASDHSVITCNISVSEHYVLKLYDTSGRLIATIDEGHKPSGRYAEVLNLNGIPNGTYFVLLETDYSKYSIPFVLIR